MPSNDLVLSQISVNGKRHITFATLKQRIQDEHQEIVATLQRLLNIGEIYWKWNTAPIQDYTTVSLCSTIFLKEKRQLTILAPDESESGDWEIIMHPGACAGPHEFSYQRNTSFEAMCKHILMFLYTLMSRDENDEQIQQKLKHAFEEHATRRR